MKKILFLLAFAPLFLLGCEEGNKENDNPVVTSSALVLEKSVVEASMDGGSCSLGYRIENPVDETTLPTAQVVDEAGWISNLTVDATTIRFEVAATTEARKAEVEVNYPGLSKPERFTVSQAPAFAITTTDVVSNSFTLAITPVDLKMHYLYFIATQEFLEEEELDTDEKIFADNMKQIEAYLAEEGNVIEDIVHIGNIDAKVKARHSTEYVIYAYGFDMQNRTKTTSIVYHYVTTPEPELVKADFTIAAVADGNALDVTITPKGYEGYYYYMIYGTTELSDYLLKGYDVFTFCYETWDDMVAYYLEGGISEQEILSSFGAKGESNYLFTKLGYEKDYTVMAFAVDEAMMSVCSEPVTFTARTGAYVPAELELAIEVTEITHKNAQLKITPTTDDTYYYWIFEDNTKEEAIEYIELIKDNLGTPVSGVIEQELTPLKPETNYTVIAFGYKNNTITTDYTTYVFTSAASPVSAATCELKVGEVYDLVALNELNPNNSWDTWKAMGYDVVIPVESIVSEDAVKFHYHLCPAAWVEEYTEADLRRNIQYKGVDNRYPVTEPKKKYGETVIPCAFAIDAEGNYGKLWKGEPIVISEDNVGDPQDFLDWRGTVTVPLAGGTPFVSSATPHAFVAAPSFGNGTIVTPVMMGTLE